jgi:hypothetical protein
MLLGATVGGAKLGSDHQLAKQAKVKELIAEVKEQAQQGAADAILKIDVKYTTINRRLETEIRENNHIYHDCVNTPTATRLLDDARANRPISSTEAIVPTGAGRSEP